METVQIDGYELSCDSAATRIAYRAVTPHLCDCAGCRNYRSARDKFYGAAAIELFSRFGIDVNKEAEIYDLGPDPANPGSILYGGWFHFIGEIAKSGDHVSIQENLAVWFSPKVALVPPPLAGHPLVQLEIEAAIPWVLEEAWAG
jgi:hypothetical protein